MDLNSQYFRHQRTLMRAAATDCSARRISLLGEAATIAGTIASHQSRLGAAAASSWAVAA